MNEIIDIKTKINLDDMYLFDSLNGLSDEDVREVEYSKIEEYDTGDEVYRDEIDVWDLDDEENKIMVELEMLAHMQGAKDELLKEEVEKDALEKMLIQKQNKAYLGEKEDLERLQSIKEDLLGELSFVANKGEDTYNEDENLDIITDLDNLVEKSEEIELGSEEEENEFGLDELGELEYKLAEEKKKLYRERNLTNKLKESKRLLGMELNKSQNMLNELEEELDRLKKEKDKMSLLVNKLQEKLDNKGNFDEIEEGKVLPGNKIVVDKGKLIQLLGKLKNFEKNIGERKEKGVEKDVRLEYDNMELDCLYEEVKKFMGKEGVSKSIVDLKRLEDEFGKQNIRKLISKSYLILMGKGVTVGR